VEIDSGCYIIEGHYQVKKVEKFEFVKLPLRELVLELIDEVKSEPLGASSEPEPQGFQQLAQNRLDEALSLCPTDPGVYVMRNETSQVIYVGKAKNLRSRVRSYFQKSGDISLKTQHLVSKIHSLEYLRTHSETEALLLENNLIKKWRPKYNIRLKDDKTYPYLKLDLTHPFPRPYVVRRQLKGDGSEYFGPFPNGGSLRQVLRSGAKVFQLRDCRDHDFANRSRPCLSYEIGQCTAPCVGLVTQEAYQQQLQDFRDFLTGESADLENRWQVEMQEAAEKLDFERAAQIRDRIEALKVTQEDQRQVVVSTSDMGDRDIWAVVKSEQEILVLVNQIRAGKWLGSRTLRASLEEKIAGESLIAALLLDHYANNPAPSQIILPPDSEVPERSIFAGALGGIHAESDRLLSLHFADEKEEWAKFYELALENAEAQLGEAAALLARREDGLLALQRMLDLPEIPWRMECVDISNFQGEANVASCVVFKQGAPERSLYRHYNIRGFEGQNDFASMKEVITRRYGKPDSPRPDLLVIDGGKGQLASVVEVLKAMELKFPVVALAKARTESDFQGAEVESSEERVFVPGQKNYLRFKNAEALRIMTHIRDEAHRFAIEFHRQKRSGNRGI